jgi:hypothetical protein
MPNESASERVKLGAATNGRGGIDATAQDEVADRGIDRRRDAVVIGAQPDATKPGLIPVRRHLRRLGFPGRCDAA